MVKYNKAKIKCEGCGRIATFKSINLTKGKFLCSTCRTSDKGSRQIESISASIQQINKPHISLKEALKKVYVVKSYYHKDGTKIYNAIFVSDVLEGKKVRIKLVEEKK